MLRDQRKVRGEGHLSTRQIKTDNGGFKDVNSGRFCSAFSKKEECFDETKQLTGFVDIKFESNLSRQF